MPSPSSRVVPCPKQRRASVDSVLASLMDVGRRMKRKLPGDELESGSIYLLKALHGGPTRINALATLVHLDASTVSRHISQLQAAGLVARTGDPDDGRASLIELTDAATTLLERSMERRHELLARVLDGWPDNDLDRLDHLLRRFADDVDALQPEPPGDLRPDQEPR